VIVFGDPSLVEGAIGPRLAPDDRVPGRPTASGGAAQVAYLEAAIDAARRGEIQAIVTAPISKTQAKLAGFAFPGHTELLAERFGARRHAMMFAGPRLKVVLATIHEPLASVPKILTTEKIVDAIDLLRESLIRDFGIASPKIGVLGLNPHAGEGGLFGDEEARIIVPAIAATNAIGPLVPDAAFRRTDVDAFVAMYHDQGLIPVKLVDFELAVNVTLGLPIVRTSPDHGVAYDIAGTGRARADSMKAALALARSMGSARLQ
jgi:4-hydroxythreonine-4-phosphate dehydrogenase